MAQANAIRGRKHTAEHNTKIGAASRNISQETRNKMSEAQKGNQRALGYIHTEENRLNMSIASKKYWDKRKSQECQQ